MGGHQYQTSQINSRSFFFRWQIEESSLLPPHEPMNRQPTAKELTKVVGTNQRTHNSAILRPICICLSRSLDGWIGGRYQQQQQSATIKSIYNNTKTRNDILRPCSFFLLLLLLLLLLLFLLCFGCHKNERNQTVKVGLLNRQHTESAAYIELDLKTKRETNKRHRE